MFDDLIMYLLIGVVVVAAGLAVWFLVKDEQRWQDFRAAHHCTIVGRESGGVAWGINTGKDGGLIPIVNPDKTSWRCDDGITYTR